MQLWFLKGLQLQVWLPVVPTFLHDAQGRQIPVFGMRDIEVHLMDETGRKVVLRESVAVSAHVQQPILCFGRLMQSGWGVDAGEQSLVHSTGVRIPLELQHQSVVVKGSVRAISSDVASMGVQNVEQSEVPGNVRAVKVTVRPEVLRGGIGWHLDDSGLGLGRHIAETYQDPALVRPGMHGFRNRTTLVKGDDGFWCVLELCEPLYSLIDMSAEFYGYDGMREVLTFITEGEKSSDLMGFSMNDDEGAVQLHAHHDGEGVQDPEIMAPEDAIRGREIAVPGLAEPLGEGREIPADRIVVDPAEYEKVVVNGVELSSASSLAALRSGCAYYGISQSGGKTKCYSRIVNHMKKLELELLKNAAKQASEELERVPKAQPLALPPSEEEQKLHELTHTPYKPWCDSCLLFQSQTRQTIAWWQFPFVWHSNNFFWFGIHQSHSWRCKPTGDCSFAISCHQDSVTSYVGCVPLRSKGQLELMTRELLSFTAGLGYSEVVYRCDNGPTMRQLLNYVVSTRLSMGLPTRSMTPPAYPHGNSLVENAIGRLRPLASIPHALSEEAYRSWFFKQSCPMDLGPTPCCLVDESLWCDRQFNALWTCSQGAVWWFHCSVWRTCVRLFQIRCQGNSQVASMLVSGKGGLTRQFLAVFRLPPCAHTEH